MNKIKFKKSDVLYVSCTTDIKPPFEKTILICLKDESKSMFNLVYYTKEGFEKAIEFIDKELSKDDNNDFLTLEYKI